MENDRASHGFASIPGEMKAYPKMPSRALSGFMYTNTQGFAMTFPLHLTLHGFKHKLSAE